MSQILGSSLLSVMTQECDPEAYTDLARAHGLAANQDIVLDRVYQISDQRSHDV